MTLRVPATEINLRLALDELECQLSIVDAAYADTQWRRHLGQVNGKELSRLEEGRAALLQAADTRTMLQQCANGLNDPLLARRIALLLRRVTWADIESHRQVYSLRNSIDTAIMKHRLRIDGASVSRAERSELLRRHPDRRVRREAWESTATLSKQIENHVLQLMRLRQALAVERGYADFPAWALGAMGLDRRWLEEFLNELTILTDAPYLAWLENAAQSLSLPNGLRPWDLPFAVEWSAPESGKTLPSNGALSAAQGMAAEMGLGAAAAGVRVEKALIPHASLCYAVNLPDDVRILMNPRDGQADFDTLFHEFGHALHWRCVRPRSPALGWESPPFNEAMACLWLRLASESDWLIEREVIASKDRADLRRAWVSRTLLRMRLRLAQVTFEFRAYQELDGDLSALYRQVFTEYLQVPHYVSSWADSPFWTSHPMYMQNYVVGEVVASQTVHALKQRFDDLVSEQVGAWLVEHYYELGASLPWSQKVLRATGAVPGSADLVAELLEEG